MKKLILLFFVFFIAGCASMSPEDKIIYLRVFKGSMSAATETSQRNIQILQDAQQDLKEREQQRKLDHYQKQTLEYQRRQAEALERQNHYLKYGY